MVNKIRKIYPGGSNKGFNLRFCLDSHVRYEALEEGRMTYMPKCCEFRNKYEVNSPNIPSDNNYAYTYICIIWMSW